METVNYIFYYSSSNKPDSALTQKYDQQNQKWVDYLLESFTWMANKILWVRTYSGIDSTYSGVTLARTVISIDSMERVIDDTVYSVNPETDILIPCFHSVTSYGTNSKSVERFEYDTTTNSWEKKESQIDSIVPDSEGRDSLLYQYGYGWSPDGKSWQLQQTDRFSSTYENGSLSKRTREHFDIADSSWKIIGRQLYSYTPDAVLPFQKNRFHFPRNELTFNTCISLETNRTFQNKFHPFDLKGRQFTNNRFTPAANVFIARNHRNNK